MCGMAITYKDSGVDVAGIRESQKEIGRLVKTTHASQRSIRVASGFGHYAGVVEMPNGDMLATHTDGVGTKVMVACMMEKYDTVGIDCIAMNVNDVICVGATPVSFVDYIAVNRNNPDILKQIMKGLAKGAQASPVPIVGGETAVMPDMIRGEGFAFDLAGAVVGTIKKGRLVTGDAISPGDVIIGAHSTGIHSNGYTLARSALLPKYTLGDKVRGAGTIGDALLKPTAIYSRPVLKIINECRVSGLAHITGGSFTKLLRLKDAGYEIDSLPRMPPIMGLIAEQGVEREEMYRTFNMGVGFCVMAPEEYSEKIQSIFREHGIACQQIGRIVKDRGVWVNGAKIA